MKKLDTVPNGEMIIYENSDGKTIIDVRFDEDTLWLTQMQMADLFGVQKAAISKHLKNIFESEELIENGSCFPFWKQLRQMERIIQPNIIIWML